MTRPEAMAAARKMYGTGHNGWTYASIRAYLASRGVNVGWATVKRWANPAVAEKDRRETASRQRKIYRDRHGITTPRVLDEDGLLRRMRALEGAGLPATQIANVVRLDHGLPISRYSVDLSLREGRVAPGVRAALKGTAGSVA